jgi:putative drug exporter of the RND superfamily
MATLLYRLGRFSYRRAWVIVLVWVALAAGVVGGGFSLGGTSQESYEIPGTESQVALDRLSAVFPSVAGSSVQVTNAAPDGKSIDDYKAAIEKQAKELAAIPGVDTVVAPWDEYAGYSINKDQTMALTKVQFVVSNTPVSDATVEAVLATGPTTRDAGLTTEFGGRVLQDTQVAISPIEGLGVLFAAVVLILTFGSLLAAGMPLISALIGVGITIGAITGLSAFTEVSSSAPLLALMIGLAVGIDYALFIISRHRTQIARGMDPQDSAALAVGTAGSAVVFAGVTVIIALLGLLVVGIPFLSIMGVGAAVAVLLAILIATTLVPAFLGLAGARLIPKPGSRAHRRANAHAAAAEAEAAAKAEGTTPPKVRLAMGQRWVRFVMKAPIVFALAVIAILGTLAVPALQLDLNLPDGGAQPKGSTVREAYDLTSEGFGPGFNGPLIIALDITQTTTIKEDFTAIGDTLRALDDVDYVSGGIPNPGLDTAIIQVVPSSAPDSPETKALVNAIRDLAPSIEAKYGTPMWVTGNTAVAIDISTRLTDALIPFGLIVVGLSVILLMMVFRSLLVPIKAALGFLLSVTAGFGVVVAVFQWGWLADLLHVQPGPILSFMPIILMAVLFGLAMDYEVFLVSGMREEFVKTGDARYAVEHGFANGARVVTAAALIMFFVFFAFVPEGMDMIKPIALGLAVGIAFDAFLVRMTLVPALMTLFGRAAWWLPKWLAKLLPNVDIEGELLSSHIADASWADKNGDSAISAEYLISGHGSRQVGPLTVAVPAGAMAIATGDPGDRRLVAATLAGRLDPFSGRAHVLGHPMPSESSSVVSLVALADVGGVERAETSVTVGELLRERLELKQPWYRMWITGRRSRGWLERVNSVLTQVTVAAPAPVRASSRLIELPHLERAVALAAVALAERTPIVMLDQLDTFASTDDEAAFLSAVHLLAPSTTTIVVGSPIPRRASSPPQIGERALVHIDLYSLALAGAAEGGN